MIDKPPVATRHDSVARAAQLIDELHTSLVPVVDSQDGKHIVGVITDKDVMRCTASGNNPAECPVEDYMGTTYETVHVDGDVESALAEIPHEASAPDGDTGSGAGGNG